MSARTPTFVGTVFVFSLLVPLGACMPSDPPGGSGSAGSGSGGKDSGGSGGGGVGSGGAGVGGSGSGGSGSGGKGSGGAGTSTPPATFATVRETVDFYCGGSDCHAPGDTPPSINGVPDDAKLYMTLTTYRSPLCGDRLLVDPGSPQNSALYLAQADLCDPLERMPKGCVDLCTAPDYLEAIRRWIANGAPQR